jgi:hypothetical protein
MKYICIDSIKFEELFSTGLQDFVIGKVYHIEKLNKVYNIIEIDSGRWWSYDADEFPLIDNNSSPRIEGFIS